MGRDIKISRYYIRICINRAVFSQDRYAIEVATVKLQNFASISMTNQQVLLGNNFGGARASGTEHKAGSPLNLWVGLL
jgi:1-pyrroline-5-carboxylate dehydrogenase